MTQQTNKSTMDFAFTINEEEIDRFGQIQGIALTLKLPLNDELGVHLPELFEIEEGVNGFEASWDGQLMQWHGRNGKHVILDFGSTNYAQLLRGQAFEEVDWFFISLSSKTGEIVQTGLVLLIKG